MKPLFTVLGFYAAASLAVAIPLAETSLHVPRHPLGNTTPYRTRIRTQYQTEVEDITLPTPDRAILHAWYIQPTHPNHRSVLILHGLGGNRIDSTGFADIFLTHGYSVLLPDSRAHGESTGPILTYGILERNDIALWTGWLRHRAPACTYLLGESMGAAIALQSTAVDPNLCAVAVESPYATFRAISYDRLGHATGTGPLFWRTLGRPALELAILYTRIRYSLYLPDADPQAAVQASNTPILLIAGTADQNIPMHHAQQLAAACPTHCTLWIVPGAGHGGASTVAHDEFATRVLNWFQTHDTATI
jgi:fermentation-respiration switch protein FrsA (DUF1100 family)